MSYPTLTFVQKTAKQSHDDQLRVVRNGLIARGVTNPNVAKGSDFDLIATAVANEIAVGQANCVILADQLMPDTAGGSYLDRWLALFNMQRRPAIGSHGYFTLPLSVASTTLPIGAQLVDTSGQRFQIDAPGVYANGALVPISALDTGTATNHDNGDALTWATYIPYSSSTVTVGVTGGSDGLSGGEDSEVGVDEPPRQRLFARLQNDPKGGNWSHIAKWTTESTPVVQAGFVYPTLLGPGTVFFAVTAETQQSGPFTSTSKNRDIASATVTGTILPYVQGQLPEHALAVGTSVANQATDIAILLSLPAATTASPAGPGGGWLDGTPWPLSNSGGTAPVTVGSFVSSTVFSVHASTAPQPGITHVSWLNPSNWTLYSATVLSASFVGGQWAITIDTPFPGISVGHFIFPTSQNQQTYINAILAAFAGLGPGEWIDGGLAAYKFSFRRPRTTNAWPYALDAAFLKQIINAGAEVLDANWISRGDFSVPTPFTMPTPPGLPTIDPTSLLLTSSPPAVLVPRNIGLYAA